ncbi:hypothetical protein D3C86_1387120 [compost metagenome]
MVYKIAICSPGFEKQIEAALQRIVENMQVGGTAALGAHCLLQSEGSVARQGERGILAVQLPRQPYMHAIGSGNGGLLAGFFVTLKQLYQQRGQQGRLRDTQRIAGAEQGPDQQIEALRDICQGDDFRCVRGTVVAPPQRLGIDRGMPCDIGDDIFGFGHSDERQVDQVAHGADQRGIIGQRRD